MEGSAGAEPSIIIKVSMDKNELKSTKAYQRFIAELKIHQENVSALHGAGVGSISSEQVEEFQIVFHTIKGTAGFFGFEKLADISSILEEEFLNKESKDLVSKSETVMVHLRQFVDQCKQAIQE